MASAISGGPKGPPTLTTSASGPMAAAQLAPPCTASAAASRTCDAPSSCTPAVPRRRNAVRHRHRLT
eukprot:scaffold4882_cov70-Phaeocystis_antarctica.AAC.11